MTRTENLIPEAKPPEGKPADKKTLFVAVPLYGGMPGSSVLSFCQLAARPRIPYGLFTRCHDSHIDRSRNHLTADFLDTGWDKMLFIDSDLVFTPDHLARIAAHDVDIVGGLYPIKSPDPAVRWCINGLPGTNRAEPDDRGLAKVNYIGTGFMCIKRTVFEKLRESGIAPVYKSDYPPHRMEHSYWASGVYQYRDGRSRWLSEDWLFCQRWRDLGGEIFADCSIILGHVGEAQWPLPGQNTGLEVHSVRDAGDSAAQSQPMNRIAPAEPETALAT
jgi:hypothetical protein